MSKVKVSKGRPKVKKQSKSSKLWQLHKEAGVLDQTGPLESEARLQWAADKRMGRLDD